MDLPVPPDFKEIPFTREIRIDRRFSLPFLDEVGDALRSTVTKRMSAALIGPAGTGKTVVLRWLDDELPEARYRVRYVKVADLSKRDMCREICAACGLPPKGAYPFLVRSLQEHFDGEYASDGLRPVLLVDEAHELRPDVLGMFRILTNFEMDSRLVLSVVLAGQPPLKALLGRAGNEAIARRLAHVATLRLLSRDELCAYVEHRCTVAGATTVPFDVGALDALYELSRGNLRAIDRLALKALEAIASSGAEVVSSTHVVAARKNLWV